MADAFGLEPRWLDVTSHDVPVSGLPSYLDGFGIAQITDAHLEELGEVESQVLAAVKEADAQVVVLTGDLIDSTRSLSGLRELCTEIRATGAAVVATLGNWEHWGDVPVESLFRLYKEVGAELLINDVALVEGVGVGGTDDGTAGDIDMARILANKEGDARLLLSHSPGVLDTFSHDASGFDLTLAGHTHGGQVRLGSSMVPWVPPGSGRFIAGWYETNLGKTYVSRGTGTSVLPVRFTCRPELPIFRLRQG